MAAALGLSGIGLKQVYEKAHNSFEVNQYLNESYDKQNKQNQFYQMDNFGLLPPCLY